MTKLGFKRLVFYSIYCLTFDLYVMSYDTELTPIHQSSKLNALLKTSTASKKILTCIIKYT